MMDFVFGMMILACGGVLIALPFLATQLLPRRIFSPYVDGSKEDTEWLAARTKEQTPPAQSPSAEAWNLRQEAS